MDSATSEEEENTPRTNRLLLRKRILGLCLIACGLAIFLVGTIQIAVEQESDSTGFKSLTAEEQDMALEHKNDVANLAPKTLPRSAEEEDPIGTTTTTTIWSTGVHTNLTVYHQTSVSICHRIVASNFHVGSGGLCGKAIYFALTPEATAGKASTSHSFGGCMIEAVVDVGKQGGYYWNGEADKPMWPYSAINEFNRRKHDPPFINDCGEYSSLTGKKLHKAGYDTAVMRMYDGDEVVVFEPERILSKTIMPRFKCKWMCHGNCHRDQVRCYK